MNYRRVRRQPAGLNQLAGAVNKAFAMELRRVNSVMIHGPTMPAKIANKRSCSFGSCSSRKRIGALKMMAGQ